jgi:hypothetical protein
LVPWSERNSRFAPVHAFRCHLDNERMDLTGQLSNLPPPVGDLLAVA